MSIEELFTNGYTLIPSLISEETCDKLKSNLTKIFLIIILKVTIKSIYQIHSKIFQKKLFLMIQFIIYYKRYLEKATICIHILVMQI